MGISLEHPEGLVAGDGRYLHGVQTLLEELARGLVPEIVEGQVHRSIVTQDSGSNIPTMSSPFLGLI